MSMFKPLGYQMLNVVISSPFLFSCRPLTVGDTRKGKGRNKVKKGRKGKICKVTSGLYFNNMGSRPR